MRANFCHNACDAFFVVEVASAMGQWLKLDIIL